MDKQICCICGKEFEGYGNNPYPVVEEEGAKCCDDCNEGIVIPARINETLTAKVKEERR